MNLPDTQLLRALCLGMAALSLGSAWFQALVLVGEVAWAVAVHQTNEATDRKAQEVVR